jgi:hypothetical protein
MRVPNRQSSPQFQDSQKVNFVGGTGVVKDYKSDSGSWTYLVEMEMGPLPDMGRIGYETTIWLFESDLSYA